MAQAFIKKVRVNDEWADDFPDFIKVVVDESLKSRIEEFARACVTFGASTMTKWDLTPDFMKEHPDSCLPDEDITADDLVEWDGALDCVELVVTPSDFYWEGYLKHTNITIQSNSIMISEIGINL